MGDLVIGAHSGVGEPEDPGGRTVESVDDSGRGDSGSDQTGQSAAGPEGEDGDRAGDPLAKGEYRAEPGGGATPSGAGQPGDGAPDPDRPRGGGGPDAGGRDGGEGDAGAQGKKGKQQRSFWKELPILIVVALVLALLIKTFLVQAFSIPSGSMENTLQIGDRVLVDKLTPHFGDKPSRGEVVVFHDPGNWLADEPNTAQSNNSFIRGIQDALSWIGLMPAANEKDLIKRVIAVGGDTVSCQGTGPVYVNGKALTEPYIYPGATPCGDKNFGPFKVPANSIWVMGDHRNDSLDSRYHMDEPGGGSVPDSDVVGRAILVAWPVSHWSTLPIPSTFDQSGIGNQSAQAVGGGPVGALMVNSPAAAGLIGAIPLTYLYRRGRLRRARRKRG
ncbi:signal peptidase I [Streptacidiphilus sp. P02-A3a]|uniref:signal peptidase I n=1 Tax=Streptacidiphilus sp. P02-A3a TaxID=2704468 RepID=UPI0015FB4D28|nr:signal peptidase I [Streptacidiphilus sp. P02-A3a]QMU72327.1 signal peptidase I [Streptacidiphilus sp. P02-A3a]